jgi:UDP-2,4-diacetamido-2,4,6-trideoxy-beta-L-altropyranose hydrolase
MNVVIRTDASLEIGTGHVMRCLTLADMLREEGATVSFVCREHPGHLCDLVEQKGFRVHRLPQVKTAASPDDHEYARWLVVSQQQDADDTKTVLCRENTRPSWLIVDHYALDEEWEGTMRPYADHIMVIDDLANRPHDCDLLLDQNYFENAADRYAGLLPADCRTLLGPQYALLRREFREARREMAERNGEVKHVMIFFGGADATNETVKALQAWRSLKRWDITVDVVVGITNLHGAEIEAIVHDLPNMAVHRRVENMAELMSRADLAIGAGGTTTWERCCMGLPTLLVAVAENQVPISKAVQKAGAGKYLGTVDEVTLEHLTAELQNIINSPDSMQLMGQCAAALVDGHGTTRVVEALRKIQHKEMECEHTLVGAGSSSPH